MRVALYSRVSTRDNGQDTENQLLQLREFASRQGWKIVFEFVDEASGAKADRHAFKRLFEAASQKKFDLVLFWSLDRFSREGVLQTLQHLERLTSYGIGFRSFTELYLDSCGLFKDAVISILAVIAKQETLRMQERCIAGLRRYKTDYDSGKAQSRSGRNLAVGRPKRVFDTQRAVELKAEGKSVREIASLLGVSVGTVAGVQKTREISATVDAGYQSFAESV